MSAYPDADDGLGPSALKRTSFLRMPPFPRSRGLDFTLVPRVSSRSEALADCVSLLRAKRVGGTYWGAQPNVPPTYTLFRSSVDLEADAGLVDWHGPVLVWLAKPSSAPPPFPTISGECDPWHMVGNASALVCDADDEVRLVAAILDIPTYVRTANMGTAQRRDGEIDELLLKSLPFAKRFENPFGGPPMTFVEIVELSGFWRSLIDSNRSIRGGAGFAFWKQDSVLPLLWDGGDSAGFFRPSVASNRSGSIAVWRSKASPDLLKQFECGGTSLIEVEDGFLRSTGLGADCVPPLSITVDHLGPYFDPSQPSELENLLQHGHFDASLIARARRLRETIVAAGLGKYDQGDVVLDRFDEARRHILVPGQVEDDRSILTGGSGLTSNLELLQRVRAREPDAYLIYKPHPDVVAGHRKGSIAEHVVRQIADKVVIGGSMSSLISMVDEVHVNTSLAGFEALIRFKQVTTHGTPFYAGWGLTDDLGPMPTRRTTKRSLDELVAATLLLYPRYLDPLNGLPCPAEIVVDRLTTATPRPAGALVLLRRLQGRLKRRLSMRGAA